MKQQTTVEPNAIADAIPHCLRDSQLDLPKKYGGKVRDTYDMGDFLIVVTTDRQSAFDRLLGHIPYKGQVLNQTSLFWFTATKHIIKNHIITTPDPNVAIVKKCTVLPIEFVVRGYLTGSTDTSLWTHYNNGKRTYCGHNFPNNMVKNQRLPMNIVTPTTKEKNHDRPITPHEIIQEGWLTQDQWLFASTKALELFTYGQHIAQQNGLILVDTKYEFGIDENGEIILIDEIHTPDSSRYWLADTYQQRFDQGIEPDMIDKEFFRLWFRKNCDPYGDDILPPAPIKLVTELSSRYITLYEKITGQKFMVDGNYALINDRMTTNLSTYFKN